MLLIYTHYITNRVKYIFKLYFNELLGVTYEITSDIKLFKEFNGIKISYTDSPLADEIFFNSSNLLFENYIHEFSLNFLEYKNINVLFPVYHKQSVLPFDPFSAGFYLVTRYEEYLPYIKDQYGRFSAQQSIAYQKYFLKKPVINIWAMEIAEILKTKYPHFLIKQHKFNFIPTIDIDSAYAFRLKGFIRTIGGYLKSLSKLNFKEVIERTLVLASIKQDFFDTYEFQFQIHEKFKLHPVYFILFADYSDFDKNIPVHNPKFHSLIKMLDDNADVGIHPSYASNENLNLLKKEINRLSRVVNKKITKSRQHFLKLNMPQTYRNLIEMGITDDYTMGYASDVGFRASICKSFNFYDLEMETETGLKIHPFAFMEGTLRDYLNINSDRALYYIKPLIDEVKAVNGTFISLWHNESLSNQRRWVGWQQIYEEMINYAIGND